MVEEAEAGTGGVLSALRVLPRRWAIEWTFACLGRYRRLSKDYEYCAEISEAIIYAAMTQLMMRRLTRYQAR